MNNHSTLENHTPENHSEKKWKSRAKLGFTLAEVLLVTAIIGILAAFGFVAVSTYRRNLKITELDSVAREIFTAAQNHLTVANASGEWEKYWEEHRDDGALGTLMTQEPGDYCANADGTVGTVNAVTGHTWSEDLAEVDQNGNPTHRFYWITGELGAATNPDRSSALYYLLPAGSIDETNRAGSRYIIEYDAATAQVYGVWFTGGADTLNTSDTADVIDYASDILGSGESGSLNGEGRLDRNLRRDHQKNGHRFMIGYYGGAAALKKETEPEEDDLENITIIIRNEEKLTVEIADPNTEDDLVLTVVGVQSGAGTGETITVKRGGTLTSGAGISVSGTSITYVLDSLTDGQLLHFANRRYDSGRTLSGAGLIPGEDILVTATASRKGKTVSAEAPTANSLFASISGNGGGAGSYTASLGYGRHLQNLDPAVSCLPEQAGVVITKAEQSRDIDWSSYYADKTVSCGEDGTTLPQGNFSSIFNRNLDTFDGKDRTISGLAIYGRSAGAGLLGCVTGESFTMRAVNLQNPSVQAGAAENVAFLVGTAGEQDGTQISTEVRDCRIVTEGGMEIAGNNAAAVVGNARGTSLVIKNVAVEAGTAAAVTGTASAGMILGADTASMTTIQGNTVDADTITVTAPSGSAGGLVGLVSGSTLRITGEEIDLHTDSTTDSQSSRYLYVSGTDAGGLVGTAQNLLANSEITSCRVDGGGTADNVAGVRSAGGFAGAVSGNLTIQDCASSMYVAATGSDSAAGGFIGTATGNAGSGIAITGCYAAGRTADGYFVNADNSADAHQTVQGRYNVENTSGGTAGGFIGTTGGTVNIGTSYTTASVKTPTGSSGRAGGLFGYVGGSVTVSKSYTASLVVGTGAGIFTGSGSAFTAGGAGTSVPTVFALRNVRIMTKSQTGRYIRDTAATDASGNALEYAAATNAANRIDGALVTTAANQDGPFYHARESARYAAVPYDQALDNGYPYFTVHELGGTPDMALPARNAAQHIGDWQYTDPQSDTLEVTAQNREVLNAVITIHPEDGTLIVPDYLEIGFRGLTGEAGACLLLQLTEDASQESGYALSAVDASVVSAIINDASVDTSAVRALIGDAAGGIHYQILREADTQTAAETDTSTQETQGGTTGGECLRIILTLDDVTTQYGNFACSFPSFTPGEDLEIYAAADQVSWSELTKVDGYSILAAGNSEEEYKMLLRASARTNSLFADGSGHDFTADTDADRKGVWYKDENLDTIQEAISFDNSYLHTALILNFRHLQNLDPLVSGLQAETGADYTKARLMTDIQWAADAGTGTSAASGEQAAEQAEDTSFLAAIRSAKEESSEETVYIYGYAGTQLPVAGDSFFGLENAALEDFDGNKFRISNLQVLVPQDTDSAAAGISHAENAGLFRYAANLMVHDLWIGDATIAAGTAGNAGMVVAEAGTDAAGSAGSVRIESVLAEGADAQVRAGGDAGGILGRNTSYTAVSNSAASVYVSSTGTGNAGGLVGSTTGTLTVTAAYAGGHTAGGSYQESTEGTGRYNVTSAAGYAGGILGAASGTFICQRTFSAASVLSQTTAAGGILGYAESGASVSTADPDAGGASAYSVGLVSGQAGTGGYAGTTGTFNAGLAYFVPDLYVRHDMDSVSVPDYTVVSSPLTADPYNLTDPIGHASYDREYDADLDKIEGLSAEDKRQLTIAAKSTAGRGESELLEFVTRPYDSALSGDEYPFKIWTKFDFAELNGADYVGDWEPARLRTADPVRVIFAYEDPTDGQIKDISDYYESRGIRSAYADQSVTVTRETELRLPVPPIFRATGGGTSYELSGWTVAEEDQKIVETDPEEITADADTVNVRVKRYKEDGVRIIARYRESEKKYFKVTFTFHDPNSADPQSEDATTVIERTVQAGGSTVTPGRTYSGYLFDGWYAEGDPAETILYGGHDTNNEDNKSTVITDINSDLSLVAKYEIIDQYTVTIQFMRKEDDGTITQLSRQPYVLQQQRGRTLSQEVVLPDSINGLTPEIDTGRLTSGTESSNASITGPTRESGGTRVSITASDTTLFSVYYTGTFQANGRYTVRHHFAETADTDDASAAAGNLTYEAGHEYIYTVVEQQTIGMPTGAHALSNVTGFDVANFTEKIVQSSDAADTVIDIYYTRRTHNVIYRTNGGSSIQPAAFACGQPITDPTDPSRFGYDFTGWTYACRYTKNDDGSEKQVSDRIMPDEDVIATASWTGAETTYTILYWQENADDTAYSPVVSASVSRNGITGETISLADADISSDKFTGFTYDHNDSAGKVIAGNGSTVVNVYYKRNSYSVIFYADYDRYNLKRTSVSTEVSANSSWDYFTIDRDVTIPAHNEYSSYNYQYVGSGNGDFVQVTTGYGWNRTESYIYVGSGKGNYRGSSYGRSYTVAARTYSSSDQYDSNSRALLYYLQYNSSLGVQVHYYGTQTTSTLRGTGEITALRITAKYGASIGSQWPGRRTDVSYPSMWYTVTGYNTGGGYSGYYYEPRISQSGLETMPLGGAEFIYREEDTGDLFENIFYTENISGGGYSRDHADSFYSSLGVRAWTSTAEDHYDLKGFTYSYSYPEDGRNATWSNSDQAYVWQHYYTRNTYSISFNDFTVEEGSNKQRFSESVSVKYEADISGYGSTYAAQLTPPGNGYTFAGWYQSEQLEGEPYDFTGKTMPAGDIVLYAKWNPPVYTVTFDYNIPEKAAAAGAVAGMPAGNSITGIGRHSSIEETITDQGTLKTEYTPVLTGADGTVDTDYNFTGWYTDSACTSPFAYATEITADITIYAGWEQVAGTRTITVGYKYSYTENGETTTIDLADPEEVEVDIGQPYTATAKMDIDGYYPQLSQQSIIVESEEANPDQAITFYYNRVQFDWTYRIEYYLRLRANHGDSADETAQAAGTVEDILIARSDATEAMGEEGIFEPQYYQQPVEYGVKFAVPEGFTEADGYYLTSDQVVYVNRDSTDNERDADGNIVAIAKFYLEPDISEIDVADVVAIYDGQEHAGSLNITYRDLSLGSGEKTATVTFGQTMLYGRRPQEGETADTDGYVYTSNEPVDAGQYPIKASLSAKVTDAGGAVRTYILWENDEALHYLSIARRPITLVSESLTGTYTDGGEVVASAIDDTDGTAGLSAVTLKEGSSWIHPDTGEEDTSTAYGIRSVIFAADAFRRNPGTAVNGFDYEINTDNIEETNYEITKEYGTLTMN